MGQTDRGVRGIYTLSSIARCPHYIDTDIVHVNLYIHILRLRHDGNRCSGGVYSAAGLSLRHTLHTVYAGLILKLGICALSRHHGHHFLKTADPVLIQADDLHLPSLAVRIP